MLSHRATKRLENFQSNPYPAPKGAYHDPIIHPEGVINLSTAENSLLSDDVIPILESANLKTQHFKYRSTLI
ncbi:uncharacterized protein L201_007951 [Kwoniella dendrophila CBS 6074]|uniref:Uncharacterized protein n=1 Tax=Kwoniella dendrophila CBS 6074 TaxID=1295534 RepID=A0AAX4K5Q1_9TREE